MKVNDIGESITKPIGRCSCYLYPCVVLAFCAKAVNLGYRPPFLDDGL